VGFSQGLVHRELLRREVFFVRGGGSLEKGTFSRFGERGSGKNCKVVIHWGEFILASYRSIYLLKGGCLAGGGRFYPEGVFKWSE